MEVAGVVIHGEGEGDEGAGECKPPHQQIVLRVEGQVRVRLRHSLHIVHVLVRVECSFKFTAKY